MNNHDNHDNHGHSRTRTHIGELDTGYGLVGGYGGFITRDHSDGQVCIY